MYVVCVSLNYQQLPIDVREQLVFSKKELEKANKLLSSEKSILEEVILSTCNRTEVYAVVDQIHTGRYYIKRFLANWFHIDLDQISDWAVIDLKEDAVAHLMRVSTGLESLDRGEPQILGQVKQAFFAAQSFHTTGVILDHLFQQAISFSKKMHTQYRVSELSKTSGQTALHQIKIKLQTLEDKTLVIVGMGQMGQHVLKNASTMKFDQIIIMNRTNEKAEELAQQYEDNVQMQPWQTLQETVNQADAVIMATSAKQPLLQDGDLSDARLQIIADLGVPRNVASKKLSVNVDYYDIDHLSEIISSNHALTQQMLRQMASHVPSEVTDFYAWQRQLNVVPVIRQLRESALTTEKQVYDSLLHKLPELDAHQRKVISKHMKSIINQMIKEPIKEVKELSAQEDAQVDLEFFCQIFGLEAVEKKKIEKKKEEAGVHED